MRIEFGPKSRLQVCWPECESKYDAIVLWP